MFLRLRQVVLAAGATIPVALLAACAPSETSLPTTPGSLSVPAPTVSVTAEAAPSASASPNPSMSAAADASPTPLDVPLLSISGGAVGPDAQALEVELTLTDVLPITHEALDAIRIASCGPTTDLSVFEDPDARMVTFDVEATGTPGFTEWTGYQGIQITGLLFDGGVFSSPGGVSPSGASPGGASPSGTSPAHTDEGCALPQLVVRPGVGTVQMPVSPAAWTVPGELADDAAVTFGQYGLSVHPFDEEGEPTGMDEITDCAIEASPRLDELAMTAAPAISWGSQSPAPEYCLYGRVATDG